MISSYDIQIDAYFATLFLENEITEQLDTATVSLSIYEDLIEDFNDRLFDAQNEQSPEIQAELWEELKQDMLDCEVEDSLSVNCAVKLAA